MTEMEDAVILHIGCGMDSRVIRVGTMGHLWYDVDFPEVIRERKRYFAESQAYHMIAGDIRDSDWMSGLPQGKRAIVVMEGVSMYLTNGELKIFLRELNVHFSQVSLLLDCYTVLAAKMSKYKNPINDVGVTTVYGMNAPEILESDHFVLVKEHDMTPQRFIDQLRGLEKMIFQKLYAGNFAKKLYRLFEYRSR